MDLKMEILKRFQNWIAVIDSYNHSNFNGGVSITLTVYPKEMGAYSIPYWPKCHSFSSTFFAGTLKNNPAESPTFFEHFEIK